MEYLKNNPCEEGNQSQAVYAPFNFASNCKFHCIKSGSSNSGVKSLLIWIPMHFQGIKYCTSGSIFKRAIDAVSRQDRDTEISENLPSDYQARDHADRHSEHPFAYFGIAFTSFPFCLAGFDEARLVSLNMKVADHRQYDPFDLKNRPW